MYYVSCWFKVVNCVIYIMLYCEMLIVVMSKGLYKSTTKKWSVSRVFGCERSRQYYRRPTKSCASCKTGKLCIGSHSHVSVETAVIAAIIGHSKLLIYSHHMNAFTSVGWTEEVCSEQWLWCSTFPNFKGTGTDFSTFPTV